MFFIRRCRTLFALALLPMVASASTAHALGDPWTLCAAETARAEQAHDLPRLLLSAISKTESGRHHAARGERFAWPWTVTAEGKGQYLPSKAAAIARVEALRARGVRNIDVGCMQINLKYHPDAFQSLETALDPAKNVAYAASLLTSLKRTWGSWTRAVGNYHSNTPRFSGPYRVKVFRTLNRERLRAAKEKAARWRTERAESS